MARIRSIKPSFFTSDEVAELPPLLRLLFAGLWCLADRDGRLEDRPKRIKVEAMPHDRIDIIKAIDTLEERGFIHRYSVDGAALIHITNFHLHQHPHPKEPPSTLYPCPVHQSCMDDASTVQGRPGRVISGYGDTGHGDTGHGRGHDAPAAERHPDLARAIKGWERQSPGSINPTIVDALDWWLEDNLPVEWIERACEEAGLAGGRKPVRFVDAILRRYRAQGTMEDVRPTKGEVVSGAVNVGGQLVKTFEQEARDARLG